MCSIAISDETMLIVLIDQRMPSCAANTTVLTRYVKLGIHLHFMFSFRWSCTVLSARWGAVSAAPGFHLNRCYDIPLTVKYGSFSTHPSLPTPTFHRGRKNIKLTHPTRLPSPQTIKPTTKKKDVTLLCVGTTNILLIPTRSISYGIRVTIPARPVWTTRRRHRASTLIISSLSKG